MRRLPWQPRILPASDPASPIAPGNLVATCGKCHANASASFVKSDPHADKHNPERNAALYFAAKAMQFLLFTVFGFFGLHTALWLARGFKESRGSASRAPLAPPRSHPSAGGRSQRRSRSTAPRRDITCCGSIASIARCTAF